MAWSSENKMIAAPLELREQGIETLSVDFVVVNQEDLRDFAAKEFSGSILKEVKNDVHIIEVRCLGFFGELLVLPVECFAEDVVELIIVDCDRHRRDPVASL